MKNEITLQTRRQFLRSTVLGSALSWTVPAFLAYTFNALQSEAADSATQIVTGKDASILVVLQMAGGNDGLNTLVPYANDFYHKARPRIGQTEDKILKLNGEVGFHGAMTGFKSLYDAGHLTVVQGVGYPNPNRSHFRSTEIWQTASDADEIEKYGWLGRYFDNACAGADPTVGVVLGRQLPEAFFAKTPTGICFDNPQNYRFLSPERPRPGRQETIILGVIEANAHGRPRIKGFGQLAAHHHADGRIRAATTIIKIAAKPAVFFHLVRIAGRLPNLRRAEMGTVRVGIPHPLNDGEFPESYKSLKPVMAP